RSGHLPGEGDDADESYGGAIHDWDGDLESGDCTLDYIAYYCRGCGKQLAEAPSWGLDLVPRSSAIDARLQDDENEALLDCGCLLRRVPVSIAFCGLHRAMTPCAVRHR